MIYTILLILLSSNNLRNVVVLGGIIKEIYILLDGLINDVSTLGQQLLTRLSRTFTFIDATIPTATYVMLLVIIASINRSKLFGRDISYDVRFSKRCGRWALLMLVRGGTVSSSVRLLSFYSYSGR